MEKETLSLPDIVDTLGQRPFPLKASVLDYLEELREREAVVEEEGDDKAEEAESAESEPEETEGKEEDKSEEAESSEQKGDKK